MTKWSRTVGSCNASLFPSLARSSRSSSLVGNPYEPTGEVEQSYWPPKGSNELRALRGLNALRQRPYLTITGAGDTVGRLLAWTWRTDSDLCLRAFASFHDELQQAVGATIGLSAIWPGIEVALRVALDGGEIADLFQCRDRHTTTTTMDPTVRLPAHPQPRPNKRHMTKSVADNHHPA